MGIEAYIGAGSEPPNRLHPSHVTRFSDASSFDEICVNCWATDRGNTWGQLRYPCTNEPEQHRIARTLGAGQDFISSVEGG